MTLVKKSDHKFIIPKELLKDKRNLTEIEIQILKKNQNRNSDSSWQNFFVDKNEFNPNLIVNSSFDGFVILGKLRESSLQYHDLVLDTGIYNSFLRNTCTGDDNVIRNITYLDNYRLASRVMLFNIQEMSCTNHSKFGNGILKNGEPESNRVWIGVANENDGRAVLPFENMITADAYLWSHYRENEKFLEGCKNLTEYGNTGELNTFGFVDSDTVIKNTTLIKDVKIGKSAYIKGTFKLKNITILSSEEEPSQIGEGVEMVNGIMGYGSRVFYQAVAVRFVIGRNCQLKYGARVLNTILGDNSTVSCCELLNNLIFPFHEQHHNSSFLIATTVQGQSNIAAGSTIGSNHNSRSPDGEIFAKRGFWPGLCSDFKHNSKFASFVLVGKGSYQNELDIPYPFSLVVPETAEDKSIQIIPAWWFMYDMFAIMRNNHKFIKRDKRIVKIQHIETDPLAPDTMQEIMEALERIINLTADSFEKSTDAKKSKAKKYQEAKDFLHKNQDSNLVLFDESCQKKFGAKILKPVQAYKMYRKIVKYFAARTIIEFCKSKNYNSFTTDVIVEIRKIPLYWEWENVGGQIIPHDKVLNLMKKIESGKINSWETVHKFYDDCQESYINLKTRYSIYLLEKLYSRPIEEFSKEIYDNIISDVVIISNEIYEQAIESRKKDYTDHYRQMTYNSEKEMEIVLGALSDNTFLSDLEKTTKKFNKDVKQIFNQTAS